MGKMTAAELAAIDQFATHIRESLRGFSQHQMYVIRYTLADANDEGFRNAIDHILI